MRYNPHFYDDLLGKRFGTLTINEIAPRKQVGMKNVVMAKVSCDCGGSEVRRLNGIIHSRKPMCERCRRNKQKYHRNDPLYGTWVGMMNRCYKEQSPSYRWYGAKGIRVCSEWHHESIFSDWAIANGWHKGSNIDRIDNTGDYSPSDCRVVDPIVNQQNRSDNIMLTYNGETRCESEWERLLGFRRGRIQGRRRMGITGDALFAKGKYRNVGSRCCERDITKFPENLQIRQVPWAREGVE